MLCWAITVFIIDKMSESQTNSYTLEKNVKILLLLEMENFVEALA